MRTYKIFDCPVCSEEGVKKYAKNMCRNCYMKDLYHKRKNDPEFIQMKKRWSKNDYEKNKDALLKKQAKLRKENPGLYRDRVNKSMMKKRLELKKKGTSMNDNYLFGGNRLKALQRDGFKCLNCGITMDESKEAYKIPLVVHHIDGNGSNIKKASKKNNKLENLATLCVSCHTREHKRIKDGNMPRKVDEFGVI